MSRRAVFNFATLSVLASLFVFAPGTARASKVLFQTRGRSQEAPEPGDIRRRPDAPPWPRDFELGLQAAREFAFEYGLVDDDSLIQRYNRIGYRVASQTGRPDILFTFHIVNVPEPNAEALPGGFVFVTKGMTDLHLSDAAIAMMLGHEMTHVTQRHFAKEGRLSAAFSLLQTAVMVAAMLASSGSQGGGIDQDPTTGEYRTSYTGREAALQGANIFGSVFQELLLRGYSRSMEMEADNIGRRYAGRAGYPASGSVELMEVLHNSVYEDRAYGYWQTHPFFKDRILRAEEAVDAGGTPPSDEEVNAYREKIQRRLATLAESIQDEPTALFVYRSALEAGPGGASSFEVEHMLLQLRAQRLRARQPILRAYGPLLADYDSLLARMRGGTGGASAAGTRSDGTGSSGTGSSGTGSAGTGGAMDAPKLALAVRADRDSLNRERRDVYGPSEDILKRQTAGTRFLELFLENFPDDPQAPAIRHRLAEQYRLSDRPDEAALVLAGLPRLTNRRASELTDSVIPPPPPRPAQAGADPDSATLAWNRRSTEALRVLLPQVKQLTTSERILLSARDDSVRAWARARLLAQASALDSLEIGSRFLQQFPRSIVSDQVRQKMEKLAMDRYYRAKLRESMSEYQDALDGYNELILLAPRTKAAEMAREGVARIQSFANR